MYKLVFSFIFIGFILGGCASTPETMEQDRVFLDEPLIIDGRPTRVQCNARKDRALEIEDWMRSYPEDVKAINAVREEFETVLFHDGCYWLYSKTEELEYHHLQREKTMQDMLRDYSKVIQENVELHGRISQLSEVLTEKNRTGKLEKTLIELGGHCEEGDGALMCSFSTANQEWVSLTN